ncbi:MAG: ribonuclease M5 [Mycoplasmatales bacterium]
MSSKTIIIVEGKSDTRRLKEYDKSIITFETSGLGLDKNKLDKLKELNKEYNLICFTDQDYPGETIRKLISNNIPNIKHAFLSTKTTNKKGKIGVESATDIEIKEALSHLYTKSENVCDYDINLLIELGIYNNKSKRIEFCNKLNISYGNNKKVLNQLNNFGITKSKILEVIKEIEEWCQTLS